MVTGKSAKVKSVIKKRVVKKTPVKKLSSKIAHKKISVKPDSLKKSKQNPIIAPKKENSWEAWQTFNPGAVLLDDQVHFLYRAIGSDGISRFGYAASDNGFSVKDRLSYPVYEHRAPAGGYTYFSFASGGSFGGSEDPRVVRVNGEDALYMTYTACDAGLRVGLTSIKVNDFLKKKYPTPPVIPE